LEIESSEAHDSSGFFYLKKLIMSKEVFKVSQELMAQNNFILTSKVGDDFSCRRVVTIENRLLEFNVIYGGNDFHIKIKSHYYDRENEVYQLDGKISLPHTFQTVESVVECINIIIGQ